MNKQYTDQLYTEKKVDKASARMMREDESMTEYIDAMFLISDEMD